MSKYLGFMFFQIKKLKDMVQNHEHSMYTIQSMFIAYPHPNSLWSITNKQFSNMKRNQIKSFFLRHILFESYKYNKADIIWKLQMEQRNCAIMFVQFTCLSWTHRMQMLYTFQLLSHKLNQLCMWPVAIISLLELEWLQFL